MDKERFPDTKSVLDQKADLNNANLRGAYLSCMNFNNAQLHELLYRKPQ